MERILITIDSVAQRFPIFIPMMALIGMGALIVGLGMFLIFILGDE